MGQLAPVSDPGWTLRQAVKNAVLLEDHLANPRMRCPDCIRKHLLAVESYADEAATLGARGKLGRDAEALSRAARGWSEGYQRGQDPGELGQRVREARKRLMPALANVRVNPGATCPHQLRSNPVHDPVGDKIRLLLAEGKPHKQAIAIALSMQRRGELEPRRNPALSTEAAEILALVREHAAADGELPVDVWDDARDDYLSDYRNAWEAHGAGRGRVFRALRDLAAEVDRELARAPKPLTPAHQRMIRVYHDPRTDPHTWDEVRTRLRGEGIDPDGFVVERGVIREITTNPWPSIRRTYADLARAGKAAVGGRTWRRVARMPAAERADWLQAQGRAGGWTVAPLARVGFHLWPEAVQRRWWMALAQAMSDPSVQQAVVGGASALAQAAPGMLSNPVPLGGRAADAVDGRAMSREMRARVAPLLKHYESLHWGNESKRVWDIQDDLLPDMAAMGRLVALWVVVPTPEGERTIDLKFGADSHLGVEGSHPADRLHLIVPPAMRRELAADFRTGHPDRIMPLGELAKGVGGRQAEHPYPPLHGLAVGEVTHIIYATDKKGDGPSHYIHEFSEESHGPRPWLAVGEEGRPWLIGGSYTVPPEGITD